MTIAADWNVKDQFNSKRVGEEVLGYLHVELQWHCVVSLTEKLLIKYEPPRGKTNKVVFEQARHKPACTSTEKS